MKWSTDDSFLVVLHNYGRVALIAKVQSRNELFNGEIVEDEQFINITAST